MGNPKAVTMLQEMVRTCLQQGPTRFTVYGDVARWRAAADALGQEWHRTPEGFVQLSPSGVLLAFVNLAGEHADKVS